MENNFSCARTVKFAKINTLPSPQPQFRFLYDNGFRTPHQRGLYMSSRIFFAMQIVGARPWNHTIQNQVHIVNNSRVGIFIDCNGCCSMWSENGANSLLDLTLPNRPADLLCNIDKISSGVSPNRKFEIHFIKRRRKGSFLK